MEKLLGEAGSSSVPEYDDWRDVYRRKWTWDKVVNGSHPCNCNNNCAWKVYVKEGIVWREEQVAGYRQNNPGYADFNPQGCQKGASYSHEMYRAGRLKYPLKRVGPRGSRRWQRISWDRAAEEIAEKLAVAIRDKGGDSVIFPLGTHAGQSRRGGLAKTRLADLIGATSLDPFGDIGDGQTGAMMTTGIQSIAASSDTLMESQCIINWVYNPAVTRIPDVHFQWESRYNGATIITVAPDQNATVMHSDMWLSPKPGTDTAIAMAMAHIIVREQWLDVAHLNEQTDLPFLVRDDNGKFLRASDLEPGGSTDQFYVWDTVSDMPRKAPGCMGSEDKSLILGDLDPALEGGWEVITLSGDIVSVRTGFELLKTHLESHTPERAARETGVGASAIESVTRVYASAKPAVIMLGWGLPRLYHGDSLARATFLLSALTGNTGKVGGGVHTAGTNHAETEALFLTPVAVKTGRSRIVPAATWMYVHGGLEEYYSRWVPEGSSGRPASDYIQEGIERGWMPVFPEPGRDPSVLIECGSNTLRRTRLSHVLFDHLWPKLDLVVTIDLRMSSTALQSDYVLPAAGYYEQDGFKVSEQKAPYHVSLERAVSPVGESLDEWSIYDLIAEKLQYVAPKLGLTTVYDEFCDYTRDFTRIHEDYTDGGKLSHDTPSDVFLNVVLQSECYEGVTLHELRDKGFVKWTNAGHKLLPGNMPTFEFKDDGRDAAASDFVELKRPWPTLTGRQQFYIDHDWFMDYGEEFPTYLPVPTIGGNYPLQITGGHSRWGIHSTWRDNELMLRLQRGEPVVYINPEDARSRGLADHDPVRVFNDVGDFECRIVVTPTMRVGQVHYYDGWESYQFRGKRGLSAVLPSQIKPIAMVGDYGHLRYTPMGFQPNNIDRGTHVDVVKLAG